MATRKPTVVKRTRPVETPAPTRVRRTKSAAPQATAAAPAVHEAHSPPHRATDEQIRVCAYYLHLERGGQAADPTGDWLRAEQEFAGRATGSPS